MFKNIIKTFCILLIASICISPVAVFAEEGTSNGSDTGITYVGEDGKKYTVSTTSSDLESMTNGDYMPSSVNGRKFEGTGTAVDYVKTETKTFYTIQTADDKVFYVIIDNTKDTNNVYFLREINEDELNFDYSYEVVNKNNDSDEVKQVEVVKTNSALSTKNIILGTIATVGIIVFLVYRFVSNKKKNKEQNINVKQDPSKIAKDIAFDEEFVDDEEEDLQDSSDNNDYEGVEEANDHSSQENNNTDKEE